MNLFENKILTSAGKSNSAVTCTLILAKNTDGSLPMHYGILLFVNMADSSPQVYGCIWKLVSNFVSPKTALGNSHSRSSKHPKYLQDSICLEAVHFG